MHWLLVNFLLLAMAYFGIFAVLQGRRIAGRLAAEPFVRPPSPRSIYLFLMDVFLANLCGWIVYPRYVGKVKPDLSTIWQVIFEYGHEHLSWYAMVLALALAAMVVWAGPELWQDSDHRRVATAIVRLNSFLLIFIMGSGIIVFFLKRLVGV